MRYSENKIYVIAEMSANHNGDYQKAVEIIHAAKEAGADAIKVQTYTPDTITLNCRNDYFRVKGGMIWDGQYLCDLYAQAMTPWEWQPKLKELADKIGLDFFSTPFDDSAVDFLEEMNVGLYKIASFELVDIPLLEKVASTRKPVIMSTGMGTLAEIDKAVRALRENGSSEISLLRCVSSYPAKAENMNLRTIPHLGKSFNCRVGLSDHSMDLSVPISAVALGATIIEKHFCLSRDDKGPDSAFSLEPLEFKLLCDNIRITEKSLGVVTYDLSESEIPSRNGRKSLWVSEDISAGSTFSDKNIKCVRPGYGLPPEYLRVVLGRIARRDYVKGTPLTWDMI